MSKSNHTGAQMIGELKQVEGGRKVEDVAREVRVSKHTRYAWKRFISHRFLVPVPSTTFRRRVYRNR